MDLGDMRPNLHSRLMDLKVGLADRMLKIPPDTKQLQEKLIVLIQIAMDRATRLAQQLKRARYGPSPPSNEAEFDALVQDLRDFYEAFFVPPNDAYLLSLYRDLTKLMKKFY